MTAKDECPHFEGVFCKLASDIAGIPAKTTEIACLHCSSMPDELRRSFNNVTVVKAIEAHRDRPEKMREIAGKYAEILNPSERPRPAPQDRKQQSKTVLAMVFRYQAARRRWIKAGRPVRSYERVAELLAICQACEHGGKGKKRRVKRCGICGCRVNKGKFLNKLRWATERCPKNPPNWANDR